MNNTKTTKRALLSSVMAMLLCVTMLIGTTFAWFTDSVTSGKNTIVAGNLDIELEYSKDGSEWNTVKDKTDLVNPNALWEPGHTEVVYLRIRNAGTLALKYNFSMNVADETVGTSVAGNYIRLSEHLKYGIVEGRNTKFADRAAARAAVTAPLTLATYNEADRNLEAGDTRNFALVVYMPESVGNEANYRGNAVPKIELGLILVATQHTYESDSFDNQYDANAEYDPKIVATAADFEAALDNPDVTEIIVASDITFDWGGNSYGNSNALKMQDKVISGATGNEVVTFKGYGSANTIKDVTISNIKVVDETVGDSAGWEHAYLEFENLTATDVNFVNAPQLNGTCILTNCTFTGTADKYAAWINSGNITLKNCVFNGIRSLKIHEAYGSNVVSVDVDGCTFNTTGKPGVVIGDLDATTSITIKNSTFNNCAAGDQNKYIYESDTDVTTFNFTEIANTVNNG